MEEMISWTVQYKQGNLCSTYNFCSGIIQPPRDVDAVNLVKIKIFAKIRNHIFIKKRSHDKFIQRTIYIENFVKSQFS